MKTDLFQQAAVVTLGAIAVLASLMWWKRGDDTQRKR